MKEKKDMHPRFKCPTCKQYEFRQTYGEFIDYCCKKDEDGNYYNHPYDIEKAKICKFWEKIN